MSDIVVVGGGVIGLSLAYELAGQGSQVTVVEQGRFGREASWAGAGILPPGNHQSARTPEALLRGHSAAVWPGWSASLQEETGIDNGYRPCGSLELFPSSATAALESEVEQWRSEGVSIEALTRDDLLRHEPRLNAESIIGYRLPGLCQIRNPRHLKALVAGCAARGVRLLAGTPVVGFERNGDRITSVRTPRESIAGDRFCLTAGPWTRQLLEQAGGGSFPIEPIRGQIVLLSAVPLPFRHVLQQGSRYLVPRPDGRILIGATEERAGFEKQNTAEGIHGLLDFATSLVPSLCTARFEQAWSGLRPHHTDGLPYLGAVPHSRNLFVAAGHFRSGLQMSPATAIVMRQLLLGQPLEFPLDSFGAGER